MISKKLPDTPWHIGYTKKKEADPRRHKARCKYRINDTCNCNRSQNYRCRCQGSAHCLYYEEYDDNNIKDPKVIEIELENRRAKSVEEEAEERALEYKKRKIAQRIEMEKMGKINIGQFCLLARMHLLMKKVCICGNCVKNYMTH